MRIGQVIAAGLMLGACASIPSETSRLKVCAECVAETMKQLAAPEMNGRACGTEDEHKAATLLVENDPGFVVGESPVLIIHGESDEQIPVVSSQLLLTRMCEAGQVVERRTYPGESHAGVIGPSFPGMLEWIDARLAGEEAESSCP